MSALIDLVALRATLAATPEPGTADEAPVSRRWLEQVLVELTAARGEQISDTLGADRQPAPVDALLADAA